MTPFVSSIGPSAHSSDSNAVNSLKIPIQETTRAMVSVSPYQLSDYGFREAFDTYQAGAVRCLRR